MDYLGTRNIAVFSHDLDSFDFKMRKPEDVVKSVMSKLEKKGKGIILMHDFQQATAKAVPDLLTELKAKGYKVVHMRAKTPLATLAQWDEAAKGEIKGAVGWRPADLERGAHHRGGRPPRPSPPAHPLRRRNRAGQHSNLVLSLSKRAWSPRPPFDPRNKSEGMHAQGEVAIALAPRHHRSQGFELAI